MEDVTVFKLVSIVTIWLLALLGGLLPSLIASYHSQSYRIQYIQILMNAFSGGVFLAGGFLHLLHDALENRALQDWSTVDSGKYKFPYAECFCSLGFLCLLVIEQAAHDQVKCQSEGRQPTNCVQPFWEEAQPLHPLTEAEHLHFSKSESKSLTVSIFLFIGLSFHSVMEGLGIGAQSHSAWGVLFAILVHKGLAAFALSTKLLRTQQLQFPTICRYMFSFSFISIIGILIGWIFATDASKHSAAAGICVSLASGTFIYVSVMEVLPSLFRPQQIATDRVKNWEKISAVCIGYAVFGLLAKWI